MRDILPRSEMARDDIRMTEAEVRSFLESGHTMILVTNGPRGFPHAMPMFYGLDDDGTLRFSTYARSQKVRNIERDPRVTLLVESGSAYQELRGVMIEGRAELVKDLDATVALMIEATRPTGSQLPDVASIPAAVKEKMAGRRVLVRVRPERVISWDHGKLPREKTPAGLGG